VNRLISSFILTAGTSTRATLARPAAFRYAIDPHTARSLAQPRTPRRRTSYLSLDRTNRFALGQLRQRQHRAFALKPDGSPATGPRSCSTPGKA